MNWRNESVSPLIMWRFSIQIRKPLPILSCLGNVCRMAMFQKRFGRSQFEPEFDRLGPISTKSVPQLCCSFSEKGEAGLPCPWLLVARKWTGESGKILNSHIIFKIKGKIFSPHKAGVSKSRYCGISILIKYSNFSRFYKKRVHFIKKIQMW